MRKNTLIAVLSFAFGVLAQETQFFTDNVTLWDAKIDELEGNDPKIFTPTNGLNLSGEFAWQKSSQGQFSEMEVSLAFLVTADEPIDSDFRTFVSWALPAKGSNPEDFILYETGVMEFLRSKMSLYQTVSVTPNGIRPSQVSKEDIAPNIVGAVEKYDTGDEE